MMMNMNGNVFPLLAVLFVIFVASTEGKYSCRPYFISSICTLHIICTQRDIEYATNIF